jgi:hypothetical protein
MEVERIASAACESGKSCTLLSEPRNGALVTCTRSADADADAPL